MSEDNYDDGATANTDETTEVTDEELLLFLEKREISKAKRNEYNKTHGGNNWERQKKRMEEDPEYKALVLAKRKKFQIARKAKLDADPKLKAAEAAKRNEYNKKRKEKEEALLTICKEKGLVDEKGNVIA